MTQSFKYRIRYLPAAEQDLADILGFVSSDNEKAAWALLDKFQRRISHLSHHPYLGRVPEERDLVKLGYRFLIVDDYVVAYIVESKTVTVDRVIHGARDYRRVL